MKKLTTIFFILLSLIGNATTYYFSASGKDDNNGTSLTSTWKTLAKFNSFISSAKLGDNFLFKRGETFYGSITIRKAGITIGAYGTGNNPVITGFTPIYDWNPLGDNIWESRYKVPATNMVVINGVNTAMGRYPNTGYLTYTSPTTTTKTVAGLTGNWVGATAVMRLHHWITDNNLITAQNGNVITHAVTKNPTTYNGISGYGLFIQNDARTLDQLNEWYYNPTTRKLRVYSNGSPTNIKIATRDTLVWLPKSYANVIIENIKFTGSNKNHVVINACPNVTIQNCQFDFAGGDCIWGGQNWGSPFSPNFRFVNNTVNHTNNNDILLANEFTNALISGNTIKNTALQAGMGRGGDGQMMAIKIQAHGAIIEKNVIDSSGYIPIYFKGDDIQIRFNFINEFNRTKMDGGGIYTWRGSEAVNTGCRIHHNIILNSNPSIVGTTQKNGLSHGIYMDANTEHIQIDSNTVANMGYGGLYLFSGTSNNNIFGNTFYDAKVTTFLVRNRFDNGKVPVSSNTITNNIFFAKDATQKVHYVSTRDDLLSYTASMGNFANNYYARPIDDDKNTFFIESKGGYTHWNLSTWQSQTGKDVGSKKSPKAVSTVNDLRFEYNASAVSKTITLGGNYIDVKGTLYNGSITLAPWSSAVLIKN